MKLGERLEAPSYLALRVIAGAMFALHGVQKVFGALSTKPPPPVGSQLWIGGAIELVGGALLVVGLFTRPVAFLCAGTMAVAYFQFHAGWSGWDWIPVVNRGELAVLYCFLFLLMFARGAGPWSLDARRGR